MKPNLILSPFQSNIVCDGMMLTSLPSTPMNSNDSYEEKFSTNHLFLSSILSHMFLMKMDLVTSRGLPCGGYRQIIRMRRLYGRLVSSWQSLTCLYLRSVRAEKVAAVSMDLQSNLDRVVNTPTSGYTTCQMRGVKDCVLLEQAEDVLSRLETFYQDFL
jgi:hypothetical protein